MKTIIDVLLIVCLTLGLSRVEAADYYEASTGRSSYQNPEGDGWWYQNNGGQEIKQATATTFDLRAGCNLTKTTAFEVGYVDLGKSSSFLNAVDDKAYASILAGKCTWPCGPAPVSAYTSGRVYGFTTGLRFNANVGEVNAYATVGEYWHHTSFIFWMAVPGPATPIVTGDTDAGTVNRGSPFIGIGARYGQTYAEYRFYSRIGTEKSNFRDAWAANIGVRF